jgi:phosphoribosylanthranilate isomerase
MARTRIKICGIRSVEMALAAAEAGADAVGFVFVPTSPRYITPEEAWTIVGVLPPMVSSVGVFVNASLDTFSDIEELCPTTFSQLQGSETERLVKECGPGVIKAVRFDAQTIRAELERWSAIDEVDAILVDGSAGGEGTAFDWSQLRAPMEGIAKPIILAGGLSADNVGEAIRAVRPYAVDVSSGVERDKGLKDPALIEAFCRAVQDADRD